MSIDESKLYYARRPHGYGKVFKEWGEFVELDPKLNVGPQGGNERLLRLGYLAEFDGTDNDLFECSHCHKLFASIMHRNTHGDKVHRRNRVLNPLEEDEAIDKEEARVNELAPIYFEKTIASQKV